MENLKSGIQEDEINIALEIIEMIVFLPKIRPHPS